MTHRLILDGCKANHPLSYLKAIGIMKTISLQVDPKVRGHFEEGNFILQINLNKAQLIDFFLYKFVPPPVISPFLRKRNNQLLDSLAYNQNERLSSFRLAYESLKLSPPKTRQLFPSENWLKEIEMDLNFLHPNSVESYKALALAAYGLAIVLKETVSSPMLINYQNCFDKLNISENYLGALLKLMSSSNNSISDNSFTDLEKSLFSKPEETHTICKLSDFGKAFLDPNLSKANNPWDYILALNGFLAICEDYPFYSNNILPLCLKATSYGWGNLDENPLRKVSQREMWFPLWNKPLDYNNLKIALKKLALVLPNSNIYTSLDLVTEAALWGINPLFATFLRIGLVFEMPHAILPEAFILGYVSLQEREAARLVNPAKIWLSDWQIALNSSPKSQKQRQNINLAEEALFSYLTGKTNSLTNSLEHLGATEQATSLFSKGTRLIPLSLPVSWLPYCEKDTAEYRLALALASLDIQVPLREQLEPVCLVDSGWIWCDKAQVQGPNLVETLGMVLETRLQIAEKKHLPVLPLFSAYPARLKDVELFLEGKTDDNSVESILKGLILIDYPIPKKASKTISPTSEILDSYLLLRKAFLTPSYTPNDYYNLSQLIIRLRFSSLKDSLAYAKKLSQDQSFSIVKRQPSQTFNRRLLASVLFHAN
jgi:CRISPR-associated protein Csx17